MKDHIIESRVCQSHGHQARYQLVLWRRAGILDTARSHLEYESERVRSSSGRNLAAAPSVWLECVDYIPRLRCHSR